MIKSKKRNPQKVKSVTKLPSWLLRQKGKWDSRYGIGRCEKSITRLYKKMTALESNEVIDAENTLFSARKDASLLLAGLQEHQKKPSDNHSPSMDGNSIEGIRKIRKMAAEQEAAELAQKDSIKKLAAIHETIISVNTILDERINKIRNNTAEKVHSYIAGIRSGKLKDFDFTEEEDNSARTIYKENHKVLDSYIMEIANAFRKEEAI